eukprot:sb/3461723/
MEFLEPRTEVAEQKILCCECGTLVAPNPANMCVPCIRTRVDVSEGIPKQAILHFCRFCERYLQPPNTWIPCTLESRELLALCLKKLKGLNKVRLVDASFIWTEPHSKRVKVNITIQGEAMGAILQQSFVVEYTVHYQMCEVCCRQKGSDGEAWKALVQIRQRTVHKKTMFYLEQLILKHEMHRDAMTIKETEGGINFYYTAKNNARKMVDFLLSVIPCQYKTSQELVSHDIQSNVFNYKYTYFVEITPICKDEVVCLTSGISRYLNHMAQIAICTRISDNIHLMDPCTLKIGQLNSTQFFKDQFGAICHQKQLREFMVMNVEPMRSKEKQYGPHSTKHVLADVWVLPLNCLGNVWVLPLNCLGTDDVEIHTRSHLGGVLQCGDYVLGFDVEHAVVNNPVFDKVKQRPDIILVKKIYPNKMKRNKGRNFKLKRMQRMTSVSETATENGDYNDFLEDLEEDPDLRKNVNMYKKEEWMAEAEEVLAPRVGLEELLDELDLRPDGTNYVLGFDVEHAVVNNPVFDKVKQRPDIILVKKIYPNKMKRNKGRNFKLKRMQRMTSVSETATENGDYNDFLEDLEEDPDLRKNVNMYKKEEWMAEAEEVLAPRVGLEELLDELDLNYPIHPSLDLHRNAKYNTIKPGETASEGLTERLRGIPRIVVEAKRGDWEVRYNNSAEEDFMAGERGEEIVDKLQIGIMWKYRNTLKRRRLLENLYYEYGNMLLDTPPPSNPLDPPPKMAPIELSPEEEFPIQTVLKLARFLTKEKVETLQRNFDRVNQLKGEIKQLQKLRRDGIKTNFGVAVHDKLARDRDKTKPYSHTKRVIGSELEGRLTFNTETLSSERRPVVCYLSDLSDNKWLSVPSVENILCRNVRFVFLGGQKSHHIFLKLMVQTNFQDTWVCDKLWRKFFLYNQGKKRHYPDFWRVMYLETPSILFSRRAQRYHPTVALPIHVPGVT